MNGEVVDASNDRQASPSVRLRAHDGEARRGVTVIRPRAADAVSVCKEKVRSWATGHGNERALMFLSQGTEFKF
jgi:hypothetical protein